MVSAVSSARSDAGIFEPATIIATRSETTCERDKSLRDVLDGIVRVTGADGGSIVWTAAGTEPIIVAEHGGREPACGFPFCYPAATNGTGRWHRILCDDAAARLYGASLQTPGGIVSIRTAHRQWSEEVERCMHAAVREVEPFLFASLRLWASQEDAVTRLRGMTAAVNRTDLMVMVVDRDSRLRYASASAEALLAVENGLCRRGGRVAAVSLGDTLRLQSAVADVTAAEAESSSSVPVIAIHRERGRALLTAVARSEVSDASDGAAVIYAIDPDKDRGVSLEPVCKLYGLSPVETKLACLLADGRSLADAAVGLHVKEQTARSYLKQIFLKTDTCRQAELVWLMLKSTVRTATGFRPMFL